MPSPPDSAKTTQLVLGIVFLSLGLLLLLVGCIQLSLYLSGPANRLTIEPILIPVGLIFSIPGGLNLRRFLINRYIDRHGISADALLVHIAYTKTEIEGQAIVKLHLRVNHPERPAYDAHIRWMMRPMDGLLLQQGRTVRVKVHPGNHREVVLA